MKAILTYARGWNTLTAVRSLGKKGIEVVTADSSVNLPRPLLGKEGRAWGRMGSPPYEGESSSPETIDK
ncbi:hypothetical protein IH992_33095 [Candidatus Poribacteria bacterium]|nr:hypothetical protein [Candidatus Poribacteria bacterium]